MVAICHMHGVTSIAGLHCTRHRRGARHSVTCDNGNDQTHRSSHPTLIPTGWSNALVQKQGTFLAMASDGFPPSLKEGNGAGTHSWLVDPKGVTGLWISPPKSLAEPVHALRRAAVCKGLRHHITLGTPLDPVITKGARSPYPFLDICIVENQPSALRQIGPHPSQTIGLQLYPHRHLIGLLGAEP